MISARSSSSSTTTRLLGSRCKGMWSSRSWELSRKNCIGHWFHPRHRWQDPTGVRTNVGDARLSIRCSQYRHAHRGSNREEAEVAGAARCWGWCSRCSWRTGRVRPRSSRRDGYGGRVGGHCPYQERRKTERKAQAVQWARVTGRKARAPIQHSSPWGSDEDILRRGIEPGPSLRACP